MKSRKSTKAVGTLEVDKKDREKKYQGRWYLGSREKGPSEKVPEFVRGRDALGSYILGHHHHVRNDALNCCAYMKLSNY